MVVLAVETATRAGSLALSTAAGVVEAAGDAARPPSERLPGDALALLASHGRTPADVDLFAVVSGPGSFTGLRVGLATVQGFALVAARPVVAIPTLEAIADAWLARTPPGEGIVAACLDGQRGDLFFAAWRRRPGVSGFIEDLPVVIAAGAGPPAELAGALEALHAEGPLTLVGDGSDRHEDVAGRLGDRAGRATWPGTLAGAALRLAMQRVSDAGPPHAVRPIYLRRPDAELVRERERGSTVFHVFRVASPEGAAEVEALQQRAFARAWGPEAIRWELDHNPAARLYGMRSDEGRLVAYCACWIVADELHINSLAVDTSWRRRGLARRLLGEVLREAARAGARSATLEVRRSNRAALALYEGLGFGVEGVRRDYYEAPREDALILWHRGLSGA